MKTTEKQILKFMNAMDLGYDISMVQHYYERGTNVFCVHIKVYHKKTGDVQYSQYHCYQLTPAHNLRYSEGNREIGISDGMLAYIGDNQSVDEYFDDKARELVMNHIRKQ